MFDLDLFSALGPRPVQSSIICVFAWRESKLQSAASAAALSDDPDSEPVFKKDWLAHKRTEDELRTNRIIYKSIQWPHYTLSSRCKPKILFISLNWCGVGLEHGLRGTCVQAILDRVGLPEGSKQAI